MSIFFKGNDDDTKTKKSAVIDLTALPKVKILSVVCIPEVSGF